jgi:hypothetical protein
MKCSYRNPYILDIARKIVHERMMNALSERYINNVLLLLLVL